MLCERPALLFVQPDFVCRSCACCLRLLPGALVVRLALVRMLRSVQPATCDTVQPAAPARSALPSARQRRRWSVLRTRRRCAWACSTCPRSSSTQRYVAALVTHQHGLRSGFSRSTWRALCCSPTARRRLAAWRLCVGPGLASARHSGLNRPPSPVCCSSPLLLAARQRLTFSSLPCCTRCCTPCS